MKRLHISGIIKNAVVLGLALGVLCSCGAEETANQKVAYDMVAEAPYIEAESYSYTADDMGFNVYAEESAPSEPMTEPLAEKAEENPASSRKIIYSSSYDIETKEFEDSVAKLGELCEGYGAYYESSNTYSAGGSARSAYFKIRVPVKNYNDFINKADTVGVVTRASQDNKDITESYFDTEARLESAKIREERVLEILKNSAMLDDVLALERELADIRYEIELYTGTLRKYDSLVSFATVEVNIREVKEYVAPKTQPLTFGERMSKSFENGINEFKENIQNVLVGISYNFIPIIIWLVVLAVLAIVLLKVVKKVKKALKAMDEKSDKPEDTAVKSEDKKDNGK